MSIHTLFHIPISIIKPAKMPPIVLCFGPLKPKQLPRFSMHDQRSGGDLGHVDLSLKTLNRIEHGDVNWIPKLKRRIENMAERNLKKEVRALKEKGRVAEAKRRQAEGPKNPWHANTDAPLREGILTVNKIWFGGTGAGEWDQTRVAAFRAYAMEFLKSHFPGGQLVYAASHSDEEAFHIHFVTATWDITTTANRGQQIQLRAAANPILRSYEHAQDLAGEYFEAIGITRGERLAEARREAKEAGLPMPEKRHHVSPSEYRAAERRNGRAEADIIIEKAVADCAAFRLDAATDCTIALKKTRNRASRSERKARHIALRADTKLNRLHSEIEDATSVLKKTQTARDTAEAARDAAFENARKILDDASASASTTLQTAQDQATKEAADRKAESDVQLKAAEEKRVAATQAADAARQAEAEARIQEQRAQAAAIELTNKAVDASNECKQARTDRDAALDEFKNAQTLRDAAILSVETAKTSEAVALESRDKLLAEASAAEGIKHKAEHAAQEAHGQAAAAHRVADTIAFGLEYLVGDVIRYRPGSETKSEGLVFSISAPVDPEERQTMASRIKPVMPLLIQISKLIRTAVGAILAKDRSQIADDIDALSEIRKRMGITINDDLDELRARYTKRHEDRDMPEM